MVEQKLLITGSAGFIGYHLCKSFLDDGYEVFTLSPQGFDKPPYNI